MHCNTANSHFNSLCWDEREDAIFSCSFAFQGFAACFRDLHFRERGLHFKRTGTHDNFYIDPPLHSALHKHDSCKPPYYRNTGIPVRHDSCKRKSNIRTTRILEHCVSRASQPTFLSSTFRHQSGCTASVQPDRWRKVDERIFCTYCTGPCWQRTSLNCLYRFRRKKTYCTGPCWQQTSLQSGPACTYCTGPCWQRTSLKSGRLLPADSTDSAGRRRPAENPAGNGPSASTDSAGRTCNSGCSDTTADMGVSSPASRAGHGI